MNRTLTVQTPHADLSEFAEAYVHRIDEERLMLASCFDLAAGNSLEFCVVLRDGTPALAGIGRVQQTLDNGDAFPPEERFDIVLDSLRLDPRSDVVFERVLLIRSSAAYGEPATGEIATTNGAPVEPGAAARPQLEVVDIEQPGGPVVWEAAARGDDEPVEEVSTGEIAFVDAGQMAWSSEVPFLTRPSRRSCSWPALPPRPERFPSTGAFAYAGGVLAYPETPPRPGIAPERCVALAPQPPTSASETAHASDEASDEPVNHEFIPTDESELANRVDEGGGDPRIDPFGRAQVFEYADVGETPGAHGDNGGTGQS